MTDYGYEGSGTYNPYSGVPSTRSPGVVLNVDHATTDGSLTYLKTQMRTRELLEVEYQYSDDPDDGDAIEAFVYHEHNGFKMWHVGGRCTANYISITDEPAEIDAWITLLTEMKKRSGR